MTVSDFQKLYDINESVDVDEFDKLAWTVCYLYGYSQRKVDNMKPKRFLYKAIKAQRLLHSVYRPSWYYRKPNLDATKITLGQFIEVVHWMKSGVVESMHIIYASMVNGKNHKRNADKALRYNVRKVLPSVLEFMQSFNQLLEGYKGLFESDQPKDEKPKPPHPFIQRYGWIFSATMIAQHNCITLDQAYNLPIIQALNDLSYLKSKQAFEESKSNGK